MFRVELRKLLLPYWNATMTQYSIVYYYQGIDRRNPVKPTIFFFFFSASCDKKRLGNQNCLPRIFKTLHRNQIREYHVLKIY